MILLGVTGSIAAYKAVEILRLLMKAGREVRVLMTEAATHFVGPLTFEAVSGHPVLSDVLKPQGGSAHPRSSGDVAHLDLSGGAQAMLIAPASAETLSQLARGGASNLLCACTLAMPRTPSGALKSPVFIAPAMHQEMWAHPATQANVRTLKSYGYRFIGPDRGALGRVGDQGLGRMTEPSVIVKTVLQALKK